MLRISTLENHQRMSTQELLLTISEAVEKGETDFYISASGQHDIGGPLWNRKGEELRFTVTNPGQRVGSMCLPRTRVIVEGPVPADAGWLNSGGEIIIRGDAGDTAGHCAAAGRIYIGGRTGARSGSLMKHDPSHEPPELWILKSTGSFSFEFMGGGTAVVCGYESQTLPSVLGERPCVGMVGGTVYFRGPSPALPEEACIEPLDEKDVEWLESGLDRFLAAIDRPRLKRELSQWKHWRKITPAGNRNGEGIPPLSRFHREKWFAGGLFGEEYPDDGKVAQLVPTGKDRLKAPLWRNGQSVCVDCKLCLMNCPKAAIRRRDEAGSPVYEARAGSCIGCGICAALCPKKVWKMESL